MGRKSNLDENLINAIKNEIKIKNGDVTYREMELDLRNLGYNVCFQCYKKYY